jgi:hypothetical protein
MKLKLTRSGGSTGRESFGGVTGLLHGQLPGASYQPDQSRHCAELGDKPRIINDLEMIDFSLSTNQSPTNVCCARISCRWTTHWFCARSRDEASGILIFFDLDSPKNLL